MATIDEGGPEVAGGVGAWSSTNSCGEVSTALIPRLRVQ